MIKQVFTIRQYWKVIVYYDVDYNLFDEVAAELENARAEERTVREIYSRMASGKAKAVTFSNMRLHVSIVLLNRHKDRADFIDSLVHEAEHIKQAMLRAFDVEDMGEAPAYTIGYIIGRMYEVAGRLLCP